MASRTTCTSGSRRRSSAASGLDGRISLQSSPSRPAWPTKWSRRTTAPVSRRDSRAVRSGPHRKSSGYAETSSVSAGDGRYRARDIGKYLLLDPSEVGDHLTEMSQSPIYQIEDLTWTLSDPLAGSGSDAGPPTTSGPLSTSKPAAGRIRASPRRGERGSSGRDRESREWAAACSAGASA